MWVILPSTGQVHFLNCVENMFSQRNIHLLAYNKLCGYCIICIMVPIAVVLSLNSEGLILEYSCYIAYITSLNNYFVVLKNLTFTDIGLCSSVLCSQRPSRPAG